MHSTLQKTCEQIAEPGNHYLGIFKGNHGSFFKALKRQFQPETHVHKVKAAHGRLERRTVSLYQNVESLSKANEWAGLKSIIQVTSYHYILKGQYLLIKTSTIRYYIRPLEETVNAICPTDSGLLTCQK